MLRQNVKDEAEWKCVPNWYRQNRDGMALSNNILYHSKKLEAFSEPVTRTGPGTSRHRRQRGPGHQMSPGRTFCTRHSRLTRFFQRRRRRGRRRPAGRRRDRPTAQSRGTMSSRALHTGGVFILMTLCGTPGDTDTTSTSLEMTI